MNARFHEGLRDLVVQVVRRDDGNQIDALGRRQLQLVIEQRLPARVIAVVTQADCAPRRT